MSGAGEEGRVAVEEEGGEGYAGYCAAEEGEFEGAGGEEVVWHIYAGVGAWNGVRNIRSRWW